MVMYAKIRRLFFREQLSISEIARRTTLTRNTLKKWLKAADGSVTLPLFNGVHSNAIMPTFFVVRQANVVQIASDLGN